MRLEDYIHEGNFEFSRQFGEDLVYFINLKPSYLEDIDTFDNLPAEPELFDTHYVLDEEAYYIWVGEWRLFGGGGAKVTISTDAPFNPKDGDLWFEMPTELLKVYREQTGLWIDASNGEKGDAGASVVSAEFVGDDLVFTKDNAETITLEDFRQSLQGDTGASIVSGSFVGNNLVFVKDDETTVTIVDAKLDLKGGVGASITSAEFVDDDIVFTKDDTTQVVLEDAKTYLKGDAGKNFTILGTYETLEDLETAHPTGEAGEAWAVGEVGEQFIYVWDIDQEAWGSVGNFSPVSEAENVSIIDTGEYFESTNVEGALQEVGLSLSEKVSYEFDILLLSTNWTNETNSFDYIIENEHITSDTIQILSVPEDLSHSDTNKYRKYEILAKSQEEGQFIVKINKTTTITTAPSEDMLVHVTVIPCKPL